MSARADSSGGADDPGVQAAVAKALELITDGARVGLGSGRAATLFIVRLGLRQKEGLRVTGVPTSAASADVARKAGIPLLELGEDVRLDVTVDGADEVLAKSELDLLKGRGGAFVRERIVAAASERQVIIVNEGKLVRALGQRGPLPVEVIPFSQGTVTRGLKALGLAPTLRMNDAGSKPFMSDNGNLILDCALPAPMRDVLALRALERALLAVPGVVDTGLFLGTAIQVLVGHANGQVDVLGGATPGGHGA